jgi:predicted enzyme related to lactoylglutathione lyase
MKKVKVPSIFQITLATFNIVQMRVFYERVFLLKFESIQEYGITLEKAVWNDINFYLCPAKIANITANENRHQFHVYVNNIQKTIYIAIDNGGKLKSDRLEIENTKMAHIKDPDNNSIVLQEK